MALMVLPGVQLLVRGFLAAINVAVAMQRGITPSVTESMELKVAGEDFIRPVNGQAGTDLTVDQLFGVLRGEPATWRGVKPGYVTLLDEELLAELGQPSRQADEPEQPPTVTHIHHRRAPHPSRY